MKELVKYDPIHYKKVEKESEGCITYNVAKCKGGYGVYVRAISGLALYALAVKFNELDLNTDESSPEYGQITISSTGEPFTDTVITVNSNRLARFNIERDARHYISRLLSMPVLDQARRLVKIRMWMVNKNKVLLKVQYYQFHKELFGTEYKLFTTQDRQAIEKLAAEYAEQGERSRIRPTVARSKSFHPSQLEEQYMDGHIYPSVIDNVESKPYNVPGLTGMCKPIKDQGTKFNGGEWSQRISQRRKRTTKVSFWNKYR